MQSSLILWYSPIKEVFSAKFFFFLVQNLDFLGSLLWFCLNDAFCVRLMPVGAMVIEIINEGLFNSSS